MLPLNLYARVRFLLCTLHTRPRVQRAPGLPCALFQFRGRKSGKPRAIRAARMRTHIFSLFENDQTVCGVVHAKVGTHNPRERFCGRCLPPRPYQSSRGMGPDVRRDDNYTGSAIEYFTWLSAKLDSIEAMPSSRVSLFFRNAS